MGQKVSQIGVSEEERELHNKKRIQIIEELVQTEKTYVTLLGEVIYYFIEPLEEELRKTNGKKGILTEEEIYSIFSIWRNIHQIQSTVLQDLEERFNSWDIKKTTVGDVFIQNAELFKLYTTYVNNYDKSLETMIQCAEKSKRFERFLVQTKDRILAELQKNYDITTYLILPVQRLPRYILLLREILKKTESWHKDYALLTKAVKKIEAVADYINEEKKKSDEKQKIFEIQNSFTSDIRLVTPFRTLIDEGTFVGKKIDSEFDYNTEGISEKKLNNYSFFLFNDILLLAMVAPSHETLFRRAFNNSKDVNLKFVTSFYLPATEVNDFSEGSHYITIEKVQIIKKRGKKQMVNVNEGEEFERFLIGFESNEMKEASVSLFLNTKAKAKKFPQVPLFPEGSQPNNPDLSSARTEPLLSTGKQPSEKNWFKTKSEGFNLRLKGPSGSASPLLDDSKQQEIQKERLELEKKLEKEKQEIEKEKEKLRIKKEKLDQERQAEKEKEKKRKEKEKEKKRKEKEKAKKNNHTTFGFKTQPTESSLLLPFKKKQKKKTLFCCPPK